MVEPGKALLLHIISEECFNKYFYEYDFFDGELFKKWKIIINFNFSSISFYFFKDHV